MKYGGLTALILGSTLTLFGCNVEENPRYQRLKNHYNECKEERKTCKDINSEVQTDLEICRNDLQQSQKYLEKKSEPKFYEVQGRIIDEVFNYKGPKNTPFRAYFVKGEDGKVSAGIFESHRPDPYRVGNCVKFKLGRVAVNGLNQHFSGQVVDEGRLILKYERCPRK